jgi:hypothetical protein
MLSRIVNFFSNIFDLLLVESVTAEPTDMEDQLYMCVFKNYFLNKEYQSRNINTKMQQELFWGTVLNSFMSALYSYSIM